MGAEWKYEIHVERLKFFVLPNFSGWILENFRSSWVEDIIVGVIERS